MKCRRVTLFVLGLATMFLVTSSAPVLAGERVLPGKLGDYGKRYDPDTEEVISGRIIEICHVPYTSKSSRCCYALRVERDDGQGEDVVYLGPRSRLEKAGFELSEGGEVCILGSRVTVEGQEVVIAQQLNQADAVLVLRDDSGHHFAAKAITLPHEDHATCLVAYIGDQERTRPTSRLVGSAIAIGMSAP